MKIMGKKWIQNISTKIKETIVKEMTGTFGNNASKLI
jgi:hypothetical protein